MEGGSVDLAHTTLRNMPPPPPPTGLTAQAGTGQAALRWDAYPADADITKWQYRLKPEGVGWRDWQTMPNSGPLTAEHTVTGLIGGETSTFLVRAVNSTGAGSASAAVSVDIPLSPSLVKPTHTPTLTARAGDGEVTLSWDEPNAIQCTWQYQQTTPGFVAQPTVWNDIPDSKTFTTEHTVGDLTNGQTYVFKVRAVNDYGQGPASAAVSVMPTTGGHSVPPQPTTRLSVEVPITPPRQPVRRPGQLYVSWAAVSATPAVNGYTLRYQSKLDLGVQTSSWSDWCILPDAIAAGTTRYTHTGLKGNTRYRYQVRATNAQGHGAWSAAFPEAGLKPNPPTKPPARRPSAPQNLMAAAANESVKLTWKAPANNGGATITDYKYRYRATENTRWSPSAEGVPLGQTTSHTVKNLTNGTAYTFEVWAVNRAGNGASASVEATPRLPPPTGLVATAAQGEIRLAWDAVSATPVSGYQVQYQRQPAQAKVADWSNAAFVSPTISTTAPHYTHRQDAAGKDLLPDYRYRYRVRAQNAAGAGAWSAPFPTDGAIVLAGAPGLAGVVLDDETTGLRVNWQCPHAGLCAPSPPTWPQASLALRPAIKIGSKAWSGVLSLTGNGSGSARPGGSLPVGGSPRFGSRLSPPPSPLPSSSAASSDAQKTHQVQGLSRGVVHQFRTQAVNAAGALGSESAAVALVPLRVASGAGQVALAWAVPSGYEGLVWQYRAKAASESWGAWQAVSDRAATAQTVAGLTNGVAYQFQVQARSGLTARVVSFIEQATPQAEIGPLQVTASRGDGQVRLRWTAPANGSTINEYQIRRRVSDSGQDWSRWAPVPGGSTARDTTVAGLTNGVPYQFAVQAVDREGALVAVSDIVSATPAGVPGAPDLTASAGDGQVGLRWDAAANNGARITRYEAQWRVAASGHGWPGWSPVAGGSTARDTTVPGLLNGTPYEFAVRAVNDVGAGVADTDTATPQASSVAVSFGSVSYEAREGGAAVSVSVGLSPAPSQTVSIPVTVTKDAGTEAGDYTVAGLTAGALSFAPGASSQSFTITATEDADSADETVSLSFGTLPAGVVAVGTTQQATVRLVDNDPDTVPVFRPSGSAKETIEGQNFSFARPDADGGNGSLTYSGRSTCAGLTVTDSSVRGTPSETGQCGISWTATDADGDTATYALQIIVDADTSPIFAPSGTSEDTIEGQSFSFSRPSASGGNLPLRYSVSGSCPGLRVTSSSVSGTPSSSGPCVIIWTVTDTDGDMATHTLRLYVAADTAPAFASSESSDDTIDGQYFSFTRPAASGGNGSLRYSVSGSCPGLRVTGSSVSGTPSSSGPCVITWTVTDTDGDMATHTLRLYVAADTAPAFASSGTSRSAIVGQSFSFSRPSASGGNGSLRYSVSGSCAGLTTTSSSVSGRPSASGQCGITWTVRDSDGDTDTYALQISVAADTAPAFASSGTSRSAIVGSSFSFSRPSASGGNGSLRYSVSGSCPGLTVTTSSVSGRPSSSRQCGITWTVRDTDGDTDTYALQISVAADTSPAFSSSGTTRSAIVGQSFSFSRPSASGGNGSLRYSVNGSCAGLTVTSSSVRGRPSSARQCSITWTVRDADGDTDTYALRISVAADTAPAFSSSGTSRSTIVGQSFSFSRPSASGGNGSLRYSVSGSCAGLTVTSSSVSGKPSASGQCGITWTVRDSDGDTDTYALQISVAADTEPAFATSGTSRSATVGSYFSFTRPSASGGNGSLRYSVSGSCAGLTVTSSSVSGSPRTAGQCGITWTVRDADGDTDTYSLQLNVRNRRT